MKRKLAIATLLVGLVTWIGPFVSPASAAVTGTCPEMTDSVKRLYSAYFLRLPDQGGNEFWVEEYASGNRNIRQISQAFEKAPEFIETYGSLTNKQFVDLVYNNVLGRAPDAGGAAFWEGELNSGYPRGAMMIGFSESKEYVELTGTVRSLAGYGRIYPLGTTWSCGKGSATFDISSPRGPSRFDVLALNANAENTLLLIDTTGSDGVRDRRIFDQRFETGQFLLSWPIAANPPTDFPSSTRQLKVQTDLPETHWTVVFYPTPIAADRPGWEDPLDPPDLCGDRGCEAGIVIPNGG